MKTNSLVNPTFAGKASPMGKRSGKKSRIDVVYSTDPDFDYNHESDQEAETLEPADQLLYVSLDRKQRKGKTVTLVEGFIGRSDDLASLGKMLKAKCGVGGSAKDGEIVLQGEHREKVMALLGELGYKTKRKGG